MITFDIKLVFKAFNTAGWLMVGTGVMGWVVEGVLPTPYPTGSFIVGVAFVVLPYCFGYLFKAKPSKA